MLRGVQKRIVQVQIPKNQYFESAYFILRPDLKDPSGSHSEMAREANRILNESEVLRKKRSSAEERRHRSLPLFFCGILLGAFVVAMIWIAVLVLP